MTELVELSDGIMDRMEIKVSRNIIRITLIGRMLNGTEVIDLHTARNNDHSAGMLTRCALYAGTACRQTIHFRLA